MKRYVKCNSEVTAEDIEKVVLKEIKKNVKEAGKGLGFIDGDTFAYAQDEVVVTGSIKDMVQKAISLYEEDPDGWKDYLSDLYYEADPKYLYETSDIIRLFKKHGKLDAMPEWYFD